MLLANFVLPKPGEGPSLKQMQHGFLRITAVGTGNKGSRLQSEIFFDKDAGYRETARMLVESALSIALENDRLPTNGGPIFYPPRLLLERDAREVLLADSNGQGCSRRLRAKAMFFWSAYRKPVARLSRSAAWSDRRCWMLLGFKTAETKHVWHLRRMQISRQRLSDN